MVAKTLVGVAALAAVSQAFIPTPVSLGGAFGQRSKVSSRMTPVMSAVAAKPSAVATPADISRVSHDVKLLTQCLALYSSCPLFFFFIGT